MAETYSAGVVTAYGAAVRGGYTGTYEEFCAEQAEFAENAAAVAQAKEDVETMQGQVEQAAATFTGTTVPAAVTTVQEAGAAQVQAVQSEGTMQAQAVETVGAQQTAAVEAAGSEAVDAVEAAKTAATDAVTAAQTAAVQAVQTESTTQQAAIQTKGQETIASIPEDYTALSGEVDDLKSALDMAEENISTNLIDNRLIDGKTAANAFSFASYVTYIPLIWGDNIAQGAFRGYFVLSDGTTEYTALNAITLTICDANKNEITSAYTYSNWNTMTISIPKTAAFVKLTMYNWTNYTVVRCGLCKGDYVVFAVDRYSARLDEIDTNLRANTEILSDIAKLETSGSFVDFSQYEGISLFGSNSLFTGSNTIRELDISDLGLAGKSVSTFLWLDDSSSYVSGMITEVQLDADGNQIYPTSGYHYIGHPMVILDDCTTIKLLATVNAYNQYSASTLSHAQLYTTGAEQVDYEAFYVPTIKNKWSGKKWVSYGDSVTAQNRWQPYVVAAVGLTLVNAGLGGSAVADGNDQSIASFTDSTRISALPSDADVVTIMGGTNDFNGTNNSAGTPLGNLPTNATFNTAEFIGALCQTVKLIQAQCPNALIVLCGNPGGRGTSGVVSGFNPANSLGLTSADYAEAAHKVAKYMGIPYIATDACGINPFNRLLYIADSVHPNAVGGELISRPVIAFFETQQPN